MVQSSLSMFGIIYGFLCYSPFTFLLCKVSVSCLPPALTSLLSLVPSCQSGISRETKPIGCESVCVSVCMKRGGDRLIYFSRLVHIIVEACKPKMCRAGQQIRDQGKRWCCSSRQKAVCRQNSILTRGQSSFMKAFNWLDTAHPHYRVWCFIQFTDLNFSLI